MRGKCMRGNLRGAGRGLRPHQRVEILLAALGRVELAAVAVERLASAGAVAEPCRG